MVSIDGGVLEVIDGSVDGSELPLAAPVAGRSSVEEGPAPLDSAGLNKAERGRIGSGWEESLLIVEWGTTM